MRTVLKTTLCIWYAAILAGPTAFGQQAPNIIFMLTDDMGWGDLGVFYQNARATANDRSEPWHFTPELDALANEGIQLRRHYAPAPVCAPSRASLLLGVHQGHANIRNNQFDNAIEDNHNIATVLKGAGYATALVGKWGLQGSGGSPAAWPAYPTRRGFDFFHGYVRHGDGHQHYPANSWAPGNNAAHRSPKELYEMDQEISADLDKCFTPDLFTARAKKWIIDHRAANTNQPFFLFLAYDTPHAALQLPTQAYPAGGGLSGGMQWIGTPGNMINTASGTIDSWYHPDYINATYDADDNAGTPEVAWPDVYKRYATLLRRNDSNVGDLKHLLHDLNIATNTLVVFSSDNGPSTEDYISAGPNYAANFFNNFGPLDGIKRDSWEGGIRVPTLAWWPGTIPAGQVSQAPFQFHDWLATFADMSGVPIPARSDGVSMLPTLTGVGSQRPGQVYVEYSHSGTTPSYGEFDPSHRGARRNEMQALYLDGFKGVRYNIAAHDNDFRIYDTLNDPQETTDLADTSFFFEHLQERMHDRVLQLRRPGPARPYDAERVPPIVTTTTNGIEVMAYEGSWPWLPQLETLTPASTNTTATVSLTPRTRDDHIGLLFQGFIQAPSDGTYTFYLSADTAAFLRIHDAAVIDADQGYTGGSELAATIALKAGLHPFRLYYQRQDVGTPTLDWQWSGPGVARQPVPDTALFRQTPPPPQPLTQADSGTTSRNTPILIDVLANDSDDGQPQPLSIASTGPPASGTLSITNNQLRYTPHPDFLGSDQFTYTATDGAFFATNTVQVEVVYTPDDIWLPLNECAGSSVHESGGAAFGQLTNFADPDAAWTTGRFGRAVLFDGVDDFIQVPDYLPPSGTDPRTIAAWIKTTGLGAIVAWGNRSDSEKWYFRVQTGNGNDGAIRMEVQGGFIVGSTDVRSDTWRHVACVFSDDGTPDVEDVRLYVDGTREAISAVTTQPINTGLTGITIGLDGQGRYFNGAIDELRIYRRALDDAEIAALAAATNHQAAAAWHRRFFAEEAIDWTANADGDALKRLAEYAFGGQPHLAEVGASLMPFVARENGQAWFTWNQRTDHTHDLAYTPEVSDALTPANWLPHAGGLNTQPHPTLGPKFAWQRAAINQGVPTPTRRYGRLRVELVR